MIAACNVIPVKGHLDFVLRGEKESLAVTVRIGEGKVTWEGSPKERFAGAVAARVQTHPCPALTDGTPVWLTLRRREAGWMCYVDDAPVITFPELWTTPLTVEHAAASLPPEKDRDDYAQKLGSIAFHDGFMIEAGKEFPETWERMAGIWKLHSVTGSITGSSGGYKLSRQPLPQKSPNFYTVGGGGTNALMLAGESFYSRYRLKASVQHNCGTNGLVFLAGERGGYWAFTAQTDPQTQCVQLDLWRQPPDPKAAREYIQSVLTEIPIGQWLLMEVRLFDDRIVCLADNIEVIRKKLPMPPCGRFGLFAHAPAEELTRFDDVDVVSHADAAFDSADDLFLGTVSASPTVKPETVENRPVLTFGTGAEGVWLAGTPDGPPVRTESRFVADGPVFTCGVIGGAAVGDPRQFRFTCAQTASNRVYTLEERLPEGKATVLDQIVLPAGGKEVRLTLDALRPNELRGIADGKIVCMTRLPQTPGRLSGLFAASPQTVRADAPRILSVDETQADRFEKNPLYVNDPFMKHWSSPEGQWITFKNGLMWFKGDIIGPTLIHLPWAAGATLFYGVPEGSTGSVHKVVFTAEALQVFTAASGEKPALSVPAASIPEVEVNKAKVRMVSIGMNGPILWVGTDTAIAGRLRLDRPLPGRRIYLAGFPAAQLVNTLVCRENVFDTLFNESLFNWTINGGKWEVINRFYCEPTWSHMSGENGTSMAALWSKYVFSGDFSVDFYAGLRMGWYTRPGDLNITVMSKACSPSDGYSLVTTGWDHDHSENYSRLYRNGEQKAVTDKYLVPRYRDGLVRRGYQPLVSAGRDIHGAWYEMQLRRIGTELQYVYDNEEVFRVKDEQPLQDGALGIWTYQNSMMVARIKIAAETVAPRRYAFHEVPAGRVPPPVLDSLPESGVTVNGAPAQLLAPQYWTANDSVSHPVLSFTGGAEPTMKVTSLLGGGSFFAAMKPTLWQYWDAGKTIGWHFEIARHPAAQVNFEFTAFNAKDAKTKVSTGYYFYTLSGTEEPYGQRHRIGGVPGGIPPSTGTNIVWTPVDVWFPPAIGQFLRVDGFGILQHSFEQEGLHGNPPKAWYAIRNFRPIFNGIPSVAGPAEKAAQLTALTNTLAKVAVGAPQTVPVPEELVPGHTAISLVRINVPQRPIALAWEEKIPGAIRATVTEPWRNGLFPPSAATVNGVACEVEALDTGLARILIPHDKLTPAFTNVVLTLSGGQVYSNTLAWAKQNFPPVLMGLKVSDGGGIETFETRPLAIAPWKGTASARIGRDDEARGGYLEFANAGVAHRLSGVLLAAYDPTKSPLLQFRYRGDSPMARASIAYGSSAFTFTESYRTPVRMAPLSAVDENWRVWIGYPQDNIGTHPLTALPAPVITPVQPIAVASRATYDYSGRYSRLHFDEVACGPAVGPKRPLKLTVAYRDPDGVAAVEYALLAGDVPYERQTEEVRGKLQWKAMPNGTEFTVPLEGVKEGISHFLVRAKDTPGAVSTVSDLPFVYDEIPPVITAAIQPSKGFNGSQLTVSVTAKVAPVVLPSVQIAVGDRVLPLTKDLGSVGLGPGVSTYTIDWIWSLKPELLKAKHGDTLSVVVKGVTDAAGNASEPVKVDIPLDLNGDKTPPTIPEIAFPANFLVSQPTLATTSGWLYDSSKVTFKAVDYPEGVALACTPSADSLCWFRRRFYPTNWDPITFPWLALSFRVVGASPGAAGPFSPYFWNGSRQPKGTPSELPLNFATHASFCICKPVSSWQADEWIDVLINVRDFLAAQSEDKKTPASILYWGFSFDNKPHMKGVQLQLRSVAIMSAWNSDHMMPFRPYDLNPISGLLWDGGASAATGVRFANLAMPPHSQHFFHFYVADRVGNRTPMWTIPVPPDSQKTKPDLPGFETVAY